MLERLEFQGVGIPDGFDGREVVARPSLGPDIWVKARVVGFGGAYLPLGALETGALFIIGALGDCPLLIQVDFVACVTLEGLERYFAIAGLEGYF